MSFPAHFAEVVWGFDSLNVVGYCRDPKRLILGRKYAFWRIDRADRSRNETWARAEESKKERKYTQRYDRSHNCLKPMRDMRPHRAANFRGPQIFI